MGERDGDGAVELVAPADAVGEVGDPQQAPRREAADGEDELRTDQAQLPLPPERAELLLARLGRAVAVSGGRFPGVAARDRHAVERRVELVLVQLQPPAERAAGAAAPRQPLLALEHAGRLAVDVRALAGVGLDDGERLERVAGLDAGAADSVVALEGGDRAVRRTAPRHGEATITKYRFACSTRPPSSFARSSGTKTRLYTCQREPSCSRRSSQRSSGSPSPGTLATTTSSRAPPRASARNRRRSSSSR